MKSNKCAVALFLSAIVFSSRAVAQEIRLDEKVIGHLAEVLNGRNVDTSGIQTRGRADIFSKTVNSVPFVITPGGRGSSMIIGTNPTGSTVQVVTNEHVVRSPFSDAKGRKFVLLLFYDPQLASEPFSRERVLNCSPLTAFSGEVHASPTPDRWCRSFQQSVHPALILGTDVARDLAVLAVQNTPKTASEIPAGKVDAIRPGDEVMVLGHPLDLLWSLTTGVVSAVRHQFPTGRPPHVVRSTVIQTQAPVNPGNSGGPLLTPEGRLIGVVFGMQVSQIISAPAQEGGMPGEDIKIPASGLNFAIAINEVQSFVSEITRKRRQ